MAALAPPRSAAIAPVRRTIIRDLVPWLTLGCLLLACGPWLVAWAEMLWSRPHYQFFPFMLLGAAILVLRSWSGLGPLQPGQRTISFALVAGAWVLLLVAEIALSPTLAAGAVLIAAAAVCYGLGGLKLFRAMLPAWVFLWLVVPLPFGLDRRLIEGLQSLTTHWSSGLLDLMGIDHLMAGNVVEIAGRRLFVEEACSGIQTLFAIVCCTLFFVLWQRRPLLHSLVLMATAIAWVLTANVVRVTGMAYLSERWGIYLFDGWRHTAVGLGVFLVTVGLIWSTDRLLLFFSTSATTAPRNTTRSPTTLPALASTWLGSWLALASLCVLVMVQLGFVGLEEKVTQAVDSTYEARLLALTKESMPEHSQRWTRGAFEVQTRTAASEFGQHSRTWQYQTGSLPGVVSVDFLFPEWHDLTICYRSQGWEVAEQASIEKDGWPIIIERLEKPGARHALLFFAELDAEGLPHRPPRAGFFYRSERRLGLFGARWLGLTPPTTEAAPTPATSGPLCQVQLFLDHHAAITPQEQEQALGLFLDALRRVQQLR